MLIQAVMPISISIIGFTLLLHIIVQYRSQPVQRPVEQWYIVSLEESYPCGHAANVEVAARSIEYAHKLAYSHKNVTCPRCSRVGEQL